MDMEGLTKKEQVAEIKEEKKEEDELGCCAACYPHATPANAADHDLGHVPHHCTDIICLLIFICAFGGILYIFRHCQEHANIERLYKGYNFLGELCGVQEPHYPLNYTSPAAGSGKLIDASRLFWCKDPKDPSGLTLDLAHPVCRKSCPTSDDGEYPCYKGFKKGPAKTFGVAGSYSQENTYTFASQKDYVTEDIMGAYCFPYEPQLMAQVEQYMTKNPAFKVLMEAGSLRNSWPLFAASAVVSIILGFIYLLVLEKFACPLVYTCMIVLVLAPMGVGGIFIYKFWTGGANLHLGLPGTGAEKECLMYGCICFVVGLLFAIISWCFNKSILTALRVIQAAADCMWQVPSLLLEPIITVTWKILTFTTMLAGFLWLLSCGTITTMTLEGYGVVSSGAIQGIGRSFTYKEEEWYMILYYIFMIFWVTELATATSQYVLAYAVKLWYFEPIKDGYKHHIPWIPIKNGYCTGLTYHLGSFAFGSFIIALLKIVRLVLSWFANKQQKDGNKVAACIAKVLLCCLTCFQKCVEFLNKNAYIDIALSSNSFCWAAKNAVTIIFKNFPDIGMLNGACWIFQWAGVGAISGVGGYVSFLAIENVEELKDTSSKYFVSDPILAIIICTMISFVVGFSFMRVFDMVADTILYCKCHEEGRRQKGELEDSVQYAPAGLDALIARNRAFAKA